MTWFTLVPGLVVNGSLDDLHGFHVLFNTDQMGGDHLGSVVRDSHDWYMGDLNAQGLRVWRWNRLLLRDLDRVMHFRGMDLKKHVSHVNLISYAGR